MAITGLLILTAGYAQGSNNKGERKMQGAITFIFIVFIVFALAVFVALKVIDFMMGGEEL